MFKTVMSTLLALGFVACAAQQQTSAEPAVATKTENLTAQPEDGAVKATVDANALVEQAPSFAPIYFEFDSDVLKPESAEELKQIADYLNKNTVVSLTIEGHCDEKGTPEYNMGLGDRRARAASEYLTRLGVTPARVKTLSYGEERPAVPGQDEDSLAKNRRGEFVLKDQKPSSARAK